MALCSITDCSRPAKARTYCKRHWTRWSRTGDPLGTRRKATPAVTRVLARTQRQGDCLVFTGRRTADGYGQVSGDGGRSSGCRYAHVVVAEAIHGARPSHRHEVLHSCDNAHLQWGTRRDNVHDMVSRGRLSPPPRPKRIQTNDTTGDLP